MLINLIKQILHKHCKTAGYSVHSSMHGQLCDIKDT